MSTLRFDRLHFFKRFDPQAEYVALRDMVIAGVEIKRGEKFDKSLMPMHKIKRLFEARKITSEAALYTNVENQSSVEENPLTNDDKRDIVMPEIKAAGPAWFKVWLGEEQIGKTVRTKEEAQAIVDEWLEKETSPNS